MLDTLAQLQRLRDSTVQTTTVALARQRQVAIQYENNLRALRQLMPKTRAEVQPHFCPQTLSNMAGYKGNLLRVMKWQEQEQALAEIKMQQLQKGLLQAASEPASREQQEVDEIASQSWLRTQRLTEQER